MHEWMTGGNKYYGGGERHGQHIDKHKTGGLPSLGQSGKAPLIQLHLSKNWNKWQGHAGCLEERHPEEWKIRYKGTSYNSLEKLNSLSDPSHRYLLCMHTFSCKSRAMIVYFILKICYPTFSPIRDMSCNEISDHLNAFAHIHTRYVSHLATIFFCVYPRARHGTSCWEYYVSRADRSVLLYTHSLMRVFPNIVKGAEDYGN